MKTWSRWVLLVLTIGGGFMGLALTVQALFRQVTGDFFFYLIGTVAIAFYIFVIVSGLLFAENPKRLAPLRVAFLLQIPWVSSPVLVYGLSAGFRVTAGFGLSDARFSAGFRFGSDFDLFILGRHPWFVGINIFAVLILVLLSRYARLSKTTSEPATAANQNLP
jgi:hypothetical protein